MVAHLRSSYGIDAVSAAEIEPGGHVYHVRRTDGPDWIARALPPERPRAAVEGDAEVLRFVESHGFPAERCAHPDPVSSLEDRTVLVTTHVGGKNGRHHHGLATLATMGDLLGRLQALPDAGGAMARPAGGWHHLSRAGGGRDEDVRILLGRLSGDGQLRETMRLQLASLDTGDGLPEALVHPDFSTPNAMIQDDGAPVIVDWTGAGRGPRIAALGPLLTCSGGRADAIDAIVSGYRRHVALTDAELDRLADAIWSFNVVLAGWYLLNMPAFAEHAIGQLPADRATAEAIVHRVRELFRD